MSDTEKSQDERTGIRSVRPGETFVVNRYAGQYLWVFDNLRHHSALYNIPLCKRISGSVDVERLIYALSRLVQHHGIFATVYQLQEAQLHMSTRVLPTSLFADALTDISGLSTSQQQQWLENFTLECSQCAFDLSCEVPIRCRIVRTRDDEHWLFLTFHHSAVDGWSIGQFLNELSATYQDLSFVPDCLPAAWSYAQNPFAFIASVDESLAFWMKELEHAPARHGLAYDAVEKHTDLHKNVVTSILSEASLQSLKGFSRAHGVSISVVLQATFVLLLSKLSRQRRIVIGTPVANRPHVELNTALGSFVNTIALYFNLEEVQSFSDLVQVAQDKLIRSHPHHGLPFSYVVEQLRPERGDFNPIYQILFVCQHQQDSHLQFVDAQVHDVQRTYSTPKSDLALEVILHQDRITLEWQFHPNYFSFDRIASFAQHFLNLLEQVMKAPSLPLGCFGLMSPKRRKTLLELSMGDQVDVFVGQTLDRLMEQSKSRFADNIAVIDGNDQYTYAQLFAGAKSLAGYLDSLCEPQAIVAVQIKRGYLQALLLLATVLSGRVYLPLAMDTPISRARSILESSGCTLLIGDVLDEQMYPGIRVLPSRILWCQLEHAPFTRDTSISPSDLAYLIYTSGTTGTPKGVAIEHAAVCNTLLAMNQYFGVSQHDRVLAISNISFDLSVYDLFGTWTAGACVVLLSESASKDPASWVQAIHANHVSVWNSVPMVLQMMLAFVQGLRLNTFPGVRHIWLSGDWIPPKLIEQARCCFPQAKIISLGGATEGSIWSIYHPLQDQVYLGSIPYGRALPNQGMFVLDEQLELCDFGVSGDIYIAGYGVARGYHQAPRLTESKFTVHPQLKQRLYKTGDRGRWHTAGYIEFLGREDKQVKIQGYRVELGEVESVLKRASFVRDAVVLIRSSTGGGGSYLEAHIVASPLTAQLEPTLRAHAALLLSPYMQPLHYGFYEQFPLSANGKVDTSRLRRLAPMRASSTSGWDADEHLFKLMEIVSVVLDRPMAELDPQHSFYQLGGTSLQAVSLAVKGATHWQVNLSITDILEASSLVELAEKIRVVPLVLSKLSTFEQASVGALSLCFVHAAGGHLEPYRTLQTRYAGRCNLFGLSSPALASIGPDCELAFEALLEAHVNSLLDIPSQGHLVLVGWSLGGILAMNLCERLVRHGIRVRHVVVVDSGLDYAPMVGKGRTKQWLRLVANAVEMYGLDKHCLIVKGAEGFSSFAGLLKYLYTVNEEKLSAVLSRSQFEVSAWALERACRLLAEASIPKLDTALSVHLCQTHQTIASSQILRWQDLSPKVDIIELAAEHNSILSVPSFLRSLDSLLESLQVSEGKAIDTANG